MLVNLYTARIVLKYLGIENYGIYNAVGGFISMFSMLSASLSTAISRFLTYNIEKKDPVKLTGIFSTSITIQLLLSILLLLVAETVGLWFLNYKMTIPEGREFAANCVYQLSLLSFCVNLLSIPYNSVLIAHERMSAFAYIGILEGTATLIIAFLIKVSPIDVLVFYSALMCIVSFLIRLVYGAYCKRHFQECSFTWLWDRSLLKQMFSFAGWNFVGTTSGLLRTQGINMLYNVYCGPVVNAAYGLSMQVFNAVNKFSSNFYTAVQPQITKSFAIDDKRRCFYLVCTSSRWAFFLLMLIVLPLLFETNYVLNLWLSKVPLHTIQFAKIVLLFCLFESFSQPLIYLMLANGKIRDYQLIVGGLCLLNFPLAWLLLNSGMCVEYVQSTIILFSLLCLGVRLLMLKRMVGFPIRIFLKNTVCKVLFVVLLSILFPLVISYLYNPSFYRFIATIIVSEVFAIIAIFLFGTTKEEKTFIKSKIPFIKL